MRKPILGIIGGMGPAATADLFQKIISLTPAERDQDHLRVLIDSNPSIPDRTEAITRNGRSPADELASSAQLMERAGADLLLIACNTAHAWQSAVERAVGIPVLSMIDSTVAAVRARGAERIGVLATTACLQARLYQDRLEANGMSPVLLRPREQASFMETITAIKADGPTERTRGLVAADLEGLQHRGAEVVIAGCTEVPLVLHAGADGRVVNSTDELARAAVGWAARFSTEGRTDDE